MSDDVRCCATCRHWVDLSVLHASRYVLGELYVRDPVTLEPIDQQPFELRACVSPKVRSLERPEVDGATVIDGSAYVAHFITGPEFGCTAWEAATREIPSCAN